MPYTLPVCSFGSVWLNNSRITTNPLALRLRAGWNHLECTSDNQSQDTGFTIPLPLANHVAMMNSAPLQTFTVSGKVVDPDRRPASQVEVFAFDLEIGSGGTAAITDANGAYRLILLVGRSYNIIYNPPCRMGLATQSRQGISRARLALNVTLPAGLSIDGSIGDQCGTPVPGGGIFAYNTATGIGFGLPPADAQGHYCISLEQGTYELTYTPPPRQCLGPTAGTLALSENRSLHISYPAGFTVAGTLKAGSGQPAAGVQIFGFDQTLGGFGCGPSLLDGSYSCMFPNGTWDLQFLPRPFSDQGAIHLLDIAAPSSCPPDEVLLDPLLPLGFTIFGTITNRGAALSGAFVSAAVVGACDERDDMECRYGVFTDSQGGYALPLQPGTYTVTIDPAPNSGLCRQVIDGVVLDADHELDINYDRRSCP